MIELHKKYSWTDLKEIRKKIDELNIMLQILSKQLTCY